MKHLPVLSSNVESIGHDPASSELEVKFKSGDTYVYSGVKAGLYTSLLLSPSIGSFLHKHIKGVYASRRKEIEVPKHPFDYHRPSVTQVEQIARNRDACKALHAVLLELPATRERSVAITKLEELSMWSNKAIIMADEGPVAISPE